MKKIITMVIVLALALCIAGSVLADLIWEPLDNFYEKHSEECTYFDRSIVSDKELTFYKSPENHRVVGSLEPNTECYTVFTYTDADGVVWGIGPSAEGWYMLTDVLIVYDNNSFMADFEKDIAEYTGKGIDTAANPEVSFYAYPGAKDAITIPVDDSLQFSNVYTDPDGRQWGYIGYFRAASGWVCFEDPANEALSVKVIEDRVTQLEEEFKARPTAEPTADEDNQQGSGTWRVIVIVVGVCALAATAIVVLFKKKS